MYDFIVIGGGFAGLQAGLELKKQSKEFLIIEPRAEVGGRVFSQHYSSNTVIELGGQWVGPLHTNLLKTIERYKIETFESPYTREENHIYINKENNSDHVSPVIENWIQSIEELVKELNPEEIWSHPKAQEWDNITLKEHLQTIFKNEADIRFAGRLLANNLLSCSASETSFLHALFYVASSKSFNYLLSFDQGAQEKRVIGGMASISKAMSEEIGIEKIKLNEHVTQVTKIKKECYLVKTNHGEYQTKKIVIACAPKKIIDIGFKPNLPKEYIEWFNGYENGKAYKFHFVYNEDFWAANKKSGYFFKENGLVTEATDNCSPNSDFHVYTGFVYGKNKDKLYSLGKTKEARAKIIAIEIEQVFKNKHAKEYLDFYEYDWSLQPYQFGCFAARPKLGSWTKTGKKVWNKSINDEIYFIGTETSTEFNGYIEGALRSAINFAKKIK